MQGMVNGWSPQGDGSEGFGGGSIPELAFAECSKPWQGFLHGVGQTLEGLRDAFGWEGSLC